MKYDNIIEICETDRDTKGKRTERLFIVVSDRKFGEG